MNQVLFYGYFQFGFYGLRKVNRIRFLENYIIVKIYMILLRVKTKSLVKVD